MIGLPCRRDLAAGDRVGAGDRPHQLGAAGADQPGDAEDFAALDGKTDIAESAFAADDRSLDLEHHLVARRRERREHALERCGRPSASTIRAHRHIAAVDVARPCAPSRITTIRSAICAISSSRWLNVDEAHAFGLEPARSAGTEARVSSPPSAAVGSSKNQQARVERQRLGDLDLLLPAGAQDLRTLRSGETSSPSRCSRLRGALAHRLAVDAAATASGSGRHRHSRRSTRSGSSFSSWWIMPMPASMAALGLAGA